MKIKKIGIINYQFSDRNYGAVLQAAALSSYIASNMAVEVEHIDYVPESVTPTFRKKVKAIVLLILMMLGLKKKHIVHALILNSRVFENFRRAYLPRTTKIYRSESSLRSESFNYSHVIVGSDQVWRPSYAGADTLIYFLSFVSDSVKRISYAASFGNDRWELDAEKTKPIVNEVKKFSAVSVREDSGVEICEKIFGISAVHVLDPTLLAGREFFDEIVSHSKSRAASDLVYYKLDIDKDFELFLADMSSEFGCASKNIYFDSRWGLDYYYEVSDWLAYIKNSRFVISDSFHCICFAIIFERPFLYYPSDNRGQARLESLLGLLGLTGCIYRGGEMTAETLSNLSEIDYQVVGDKLNVLRNDSLRFLCDSLDV